MSSNNWAEDNLQVIRTLMERASLYRRKMAPMMFLAAGLGTVGGMAANPLGIKTVQTFCLYWGGIACAILLLSGYIVRGQAMRSGEGFWTPPTKRIFEAFLPVLLAGGALGLAFIFRSGGMLWFKGQLLASVWCVLYGLGLHSAGFFVAKGIRRLGWLFILSGALMWFLMQGNEWFLTVDPNFIMGSVFGGLHLLSGLYLFYTEQGETVA